MFNGVIHRKTEKDPYTIARKRTLPKPLLQLWESKRLKMLLVCLIGSDLMQTRFVLQEHNLLSDASELEIRCGGLSRPCIRNLEQTIFHNRGRDTPHRPTERPVGRTLKKRVQAVSEVLIAARPPTWTNPAS
jgi:hypothetical protein